jgi:threonine dehydrogenase-like Zn-dependent dehydrogenase
MVAGAKQKTPKCVIALDTLDWKLDLAKKCGADHVFNPTKVDVRKEVEKLSEGYGCDVYLEATGHPSSVVQGLNCIARMGRFVEYSVFGKEVTADWSIISDTKELRIIGGHLGPYCWPKAIDMVANGQLPLDEIITHKLPMTDFLSGIKMVLSSKESIKIMLVPGK